MKSTLRNLALAALSLGLAAAVHATTITGAVTFAGSVVLTPNNIATATGVSSWSNVIVLDVSTGSVLDSTINPGQSVTLAAPWSFNSGALASFWNVGGFTFDLIGSTLVTQTATGIIVTGTGTLSGNGYEATYGNWSFSTQDTSANGKFSFSASSAVVPDGGTTALLLGAGLMTLAGVARARKYLA